MTISGGGAPNHPPTPSPGAFFMGHYANTTKTQKPNRKAQNTKYSEQGMRLLERNERVPYSEAST